MNGIAGSESGSGSGFITKPAAVVLDDGKEALSSESEMV